MVMAADEAGERWRVYTIRMPTGHAEPEVKIRIYGGEVGDAPEDSAAQAVGDRLGRVAQEMARLRQELTPKYTVQVADDTEVLRARARDTTNSAVLALQMVE